MTKTYSAIELAGLPGMPRTKRRVQAMAMRLNWAFVERGARGGTTRRYLLESLPARTQVVLLGRGANASETIALEQATASQREAVAERMPLVCAIADRIREGASVQIATEQVAETCEHSARTLRRWWDLVRGTDTADWPSRLAPGWRAGHHATAEIHPDAWDMFRDDYLDLVQPSLKSVHRRVAKAAAQRGWGPIPSVNVFARRIKQIPLDVLILRREGMRALDRALPTQRRIKTHLGALEVVNADGHRCDVMVLWPDGTLERPFVVGYQDVRSSKILSWRVDRTENVEPCRLAFADMVTEYGVPQHTLLDNGRAWASKSLSGGTATRYRNKILPEDPQGVFVACGTVVHWSQPYSGRSKPIERAWRDFCGDISKSPELRVAYLGNKPDARPETYDPRNAVPLERFLEALAKGVAEHNARTGRAAHGGRSFDEVFAEAYAQATVRKLTEAQRRALWLSSAHIKVRRNGTVSFWKQGDLDITYTSDALRQHRGKFVTLRVDPDHLRDGAHAYECDGTYIGFCHLVGEAPFLSLEHAQAHARATRATKNAIRRLAKTTTRFTPSELATLCADVAAKPAEQLRARVTAPVFGDALPRIPSDLRVEPTAEERAVHEERGAQVIELGARSATRLARRDDDIDFGELGAFARSKLANQRR